MMYRYDDSTAEFKMLFGAWCRKSLMVHWIWASEINPLYLHSSSPLRWDGVLGLFVSFPNPIVYIHCTHEEEHIEHTLNAHSYSKTQMIYNRASTQSTFHFHHFHWIHVHPVLGKELAWYGDMFILSLLVICSRWWNSLSSDRVIVPFCVWS